MKTLLSTATLLLFLTCTALGQGYVFRVLANKGTNKVKRASNGETQPLKTGATLNNGDELIAGNGAYIGLMHKTGKTIEVRTSGTTKIVDLEKKLASTKSGVANRYAQFVMNKMNEDDGNVNRNYRLNSKATGAVTRATGGDSKIKIMIPSSDAVFLNPNAIIRWSEIEGDPTYVVSIKNIFSEEIMKVETQQNTIKVNFDDENLLEERLVLFTVHLKDNESIASSEYGIKRMSEEDAQTVTENLNVLRAEVSDDSPLNKLIYASFYEENNLMIDALTKYEEALELSPGVEDFRILRDEFLMNNGLN